MRFPGAIGINSDALRLPPVMHAARACGSAHEIWGIGVEVEEGFVFKAARSEKRVRMRRALLPCRLFMSPFAMRQAERCFARAARRCYALAPERVFPAVCADMRAAHVLKPARTSSSRVGVSPVLGASHIYCIL